MKTATHYLSLFWVILLFTACGDNAYDGQTGLIGTSASSTNLARSLNQNILRSNADSALEAATALTAQLQQLKNDVSLSNYTATTADFSETMQAWKRVETTYIIKDYEPRLTDLPQEIDQFNVGKNVILANELDPTLNSVSCNTANLFKTRQKTINALEYVLYGDEHNSSSQRVSLMQDNSCYPKIALFIAQSIEEKLTQIQSFYQGSNAFEQDLSIASENLINVLIDSSYKLKEQRVGDPSGLTVKFRDHPDAKNTEYPRSKLSLIAIRTILETHKRVMDQGLYDISVSGGAQNEADLVRGDIDEALTACDAFDTPFEDALNTSKAERLYQKLSALHDAYYVSLISALNLTTDIIEADGD